MKLCKDVSVIVPRLLKSAYTLLGVYITQALKMSSVANVK